MFDAAYPDGLLSIQGWRVRYRGQDWMIHQERPFWRRNDICDPIWLVSHEASDCIVVTLEHICWSRAEAARKLVSVLSNITEEALQEAIRKASLKRPTNRLSE